MNIEQCLIGCIIKDEAALSYAVENLSSICFKDDVCRKVFDICGMMFVQGKPIDMIMVAKELDNMELGQAKDYLYKCACLVPHTGNYKSYVENILEAHTFDNIKNALETTLFSCETTEEMLNSLFNITETNSYKSNKPVKLSEACKDYVKSEKETFILTGFTRLDKYLHGFKSGGLYFIGGRSAMGKTALALAMTLSAARQKKKVLLISLEMTRQELAARFLSMETRIEHDKLQNRNYSDKEKEKLQVTSGIGVFDYINIIDDSYITTTKLRSIIQREKPDIVFIDYIGLISSVHKTESRQQEVSQIARELKSIAKDYKIPVVSLTQLNRDVEKSKDHKPKLSDIRESGSIEQDADGVIFVYREGYYDYEAPQDEAKLIIAKNRHGQTGELDINWNGSIMKYYDGFDY